MFKDLWAERGWPSVSLKGRSCVLAAVPSHHACDVFCSLCTTSQVFSGILGSPPRRNAWRSVSPSSPPFTLLVASTCSTEVSEEAPSQFPRPITVSPAAPALQRVNPGAPHLRLGRGRPSALSHLHHTQAKSPSRIHSRGRL